MTKETTTFPVILSRKLDLNNKVIQVHQYLHSPLYHYL